jgi:Protein of unknown function (DUF3108)
MKIRSLLAALAAAALTTSASAQTLKPFSLTFELTWKGMSAGTSTLVLKHAAQDNWTYESRSHARGIFRLALSGEVTQNSTLRITPEGVQPLHFQGDDGTSQTARDVELRFDWERRRATGTAEDRPVDVAIEPGVQDGMSVQIALMLELAKGNTPTGFRLLDKNMVKDYEYSHQGEETIDTALGRLRTVTYRSRRPDSRYSTWYWVAPELGYLPVKVERRKVDDVQWSMRVQKLERS